MYDKNHPFPRNNNIMTCDMRLIGKQTTGNWKPGSSPMDNIVIFSFYANSELLNKA